MLARLPLETLYIGTAVGFCVMGSGSANKVLATLRKNTNALKDSLGASDAKIAAKTGVSVKTGKQRRERAP